ncbi:hypothetical protein K435DRAFT_794583 [Dendrothele bispora CBS 962.96]|uniref:Uncharacterized protein n=1 Tax=Dendrothele bispora (strain CBS 962.96) TaxID=1314807 RepID=A0A4S8MD02_DENBC|nr:hypothetical protein K435DRAFT_794583 [Dendrothele bispora CBS 962.96]
MGDTDTMNEGAGTAGSKKKKGEKAKGKKTETKEELVSPAVKVTVAAGVKPTIGNQDGTKSLAQPAPSATPAPVLAASKQGSSKLAASTAFLATEDTTDGNGPASRNQSPPKLPQLLLWQPGLMPTGEEGGDEKLCCGRLHEKPVHERLLPRARKTGVEEIFLLAAPRARIISTNSEAYNADHDHDHDVDYLTEDGLGGEEDEDDDDGWGVVTSRRRKIINPASFSSEGGLRRGIEEKERERVGKLGDYRKEQTKEKMKEQQQPSKKGGRQAKIDELYGGGGNMKAGIDERGKLVWE